MARKLRYKNIADSLDIEALEQALGWEPESSDGIEDTGFCPFPENHMHGDTTGKFSINREKAVYNCWVCGGGSMLSLVMQMQDIDEDEALEFLVEFAVGDQRSDDDFVDEFVASFTDAEKRVDLMPYFNERVLSRFDTDVPELREWAERRGIDPVAMHDFGVCWAESYRHPAPRGGKFADDEDYYGPAILFPHFWQGRLVGWQVRWHEDERPKWIPKYVNTHDFPKTLTLYGWDFIKENDDVPLVVVESVPTVQFLKSSFLSAVATFGALVSEEQLRLLRRFQNGVILARDNDPAGETWLHECTEYLQRYIPVYHAPVVPGDNSDLGDLAPDHEELYAYLMRATPA